MAPIGSTAIRNVALIGHQGAGKTTLVESLLATAGVITRKGTVEDGTTVSDYDQESIRHHLSTSTTLVSCQFGTVHQYQYNLLDTPGLVDYLHEVEVALSVADLAVVVVSAVDGVEVQTEAVWELAAERQLPRLIFLNKLDRERSSFERVVAELTDRFGAGIAPLEIPIGEEAGFFGVADLLTDVAMTYPTPTAGAARAGVIGPIPDSIAELEHRTREQLVEGIVVADDEMMAAYLDGQVPSPEALEQTLAAGIASATVFPVICGSALRDIAIDRLASLLGEVGPSPLDRRPVEVVAGTESVRVPLDPGGEPLVRVWKTVTDPYVGRISFVHVLSGTLKCEQSLYNPRTHTEERLHTLVRVQGREMTAIQSVEAGDLVAIPKLSATSTGDTLTTRSSPVRLELPGPPAPVLCIGIRPKAKGDDDKLMTALHRLIEEDPALEVRRDDEQHQTVLCGAGDTHLQIATELLSRKYGVAVETEELKLPYRETITATAEAEGRYKKQTGGHGQFGVCQLRVRPLERGEGFRFVDEIVGGAIPRQFLPAVQKGVEEALAAGGVRGFPVVDLEVTCYDGKYHPVDSSEMSFKMAGALGVKEALARAGSVVLEPIARIELVIPVRSQGDVLGDLAARRGRILATEPDGATDQRIEALVPSSELVRYVTELRAITAGRGRFRSEHDHYDILPAALADRLLGAPAKGGAAAERH
jgi:elongation factor G